MRKWTDQLAEELHKPARRKFPQRRVISSGIDNIWSADLVDMQAFSRQNKGNKYLLNVIDVFSKYAWSVPIKKKTGVDMVKAFQTILEGGRKPGFIWVDQGSEFINRTFRGFLKDNQIELYHTYNAGKAVIIERFNRTLKSYMWKYFTANNTNKYLDVLPDMIHKYNNKIHNSIGMKPVQASEAKNAQEVYLALYENEPVKKANPQLKVNDLVRISKKKKIFEKGYTPNWTEEVFKISAIQNTNPVTYKLKDLNGDLLQGSFYSQELQKTEQDTFRIEKVIKKDYKNKKAFVQWKGYSNNFNSWINLKDIERLK